MAPICPLISQMFLLAFWGSSLSSHAARASSSSSQSQSRSLSPRILRNKLSDAGILLKRRDISRLVTVQGYYGMIIGQAYEDEILHEILLDGQTETIFLTGDEFTLLVPDHKVLFVTSCIVQSSIKIMCMFFFDNTPIINGKTTSFRVSPILERLWKSMVWRMFF